MDNTSRPTSVLAVEQWLRSLVDEGTLGKMKSDHGEYPFLFGMSTVKLAEANREIVRLEQVLAEVRADIQAAQELLS